MDMRSWDRTRAPDHRRGRTGPRGGPRRHHGSRARLPGDFFRAMASLYLELAPDQTREGLARLLVERLELNAIDYHVKTVRRQILGQVASVPPEIEQEMRSLTDEILRSRGLGSPEAELEKRGLMFSAELRRSKYVDRARLEAMAEVWLHFNPGRSKRSLARELRKGMADLGAKMSFEAVLSRLSGRGKVVRRELLELMLEMLETHGIYGEEAGRAYIEAAKSEIERSLAGRELVDSERFQELCRLWQIERREASTRKLAQLLQERLAQQGVRLGIDHLQRSIAGKTDRVRADVVTALEVVLSETLPEGVPGDDRIAASRSVVRETDLAWVQCQPIAELAKEWLTDNPEVSMRQLAMKVAASIRRMGYTTSHNSIQPILGGWKKKTRGYVYRAMLKQFGDRGNAKIPTEHILSPIARRTESPKSKAKISRSSSSPRAGSSGLADYVARVRSYLPNATSPHFVALAALRAQALFGVDADEVRAQITGTPKPARRRGRPEAFDADERRQLGE